MNGADPFPLMFENNRKAHAKFTEFACKGITPVSGGTVCKLTGESPAWISRYLSCLYNVSSGQAKSLQPCMPTQSIK